MELVQELALTAFFAVLFSYLVAKLVSFAMAPAGDSDSTTLLKDVDGDTIMEKLQFGENLNVGILESENRVEFVEETVEKVEKIQSQVQHVEEIVKPVPCDEEMETECFQVPEKSTEVAGPCKDSSEEGVVQKEAKIDDDPLEEIFENKQVEETAEESTLNDNAIIEQSGEIREPKDGLVIDEDDEWEGIERSELEKVFGAAAKFLGSGDKDDLVSDVLMELYGLHKIATEGPCHVPQPMALMVSARAKWNAWQRLGNMSPEEAMEQYVKLLSDRVPGWMEEHCSGDDTLASQEAGKSEAVASALGSFSGHQTNCTNERNPELKSDSEAGDLNGGSSLETTAKE